GAGTRAGGRPPPTGSTARRRRGTAGSPATAGPSRWPAGGAARTARSPRRPPRGGRRPPTSIPDPSPAPPTAGARTARAPIAPSPQAFADRARDLLAALGLAEIVSWGFVPRAWLAPLGAPLAEGVVVKNPISADYEVMRTSLLPALLDAARRNVVRGVADVGLFEVGPVVWRGGDAKDAPQEPSYAAAILVGRRAD